MNWRLTCARQFPREGVSIVEFAITVSVMLYVIFGVVDLGRAFFLYGVVTNTAREGARYATIAGHTDAQVQSYVNSAAGVNGIGVTVTPATRVAGAPVVVQTSFTFAPITPLISQICCSGGPVTLVSRSSMTVER